jgi:hypothetical protein
MGIEHWEFLYINFKGTPSYILPNAFYRAVKPKILKFSANNIRCCESHAAPFNLLFNNISTNLDGATGLKYRINGAANIKNRFPF